MLKSGRSQPNKTQLPKRDKKQGFEMKARREGERRQRGRKGAEEGGEPRVKQEKKKPKARRLVAKVTRMGTLVTSLAQNVRIISQATRTI